MRPRAKKFFVRSTCLLVISRSASAFALSVLIGTGNTRYAFSESSVSGLDAKAALDRLPFVKASLLTMTAPPGCRSATLVLSAAGFIATSTSGASPGVWMSDAEKLIWKPDTPGSEPAGARISAG